MSLCYTLCVVAISIAVPFIHVIIGLTDIFSIILSGAIIIRKARGD